MAQITPYEEAAFARCVRSGKHPLNEIRFGILNHEEIIQPSQAARSVGVASKTLPRAMKDPEFATQTGPVDNAAQQAQQQATWSCR